MDSYYIILFVIVFLVILPGLPGGEGWLQSSRF